MTVRRSFWEHRPARHPVMSILVTVVAIFAGSASLEAGLIQIQRTEMKTSKFSGEGIQSDWHVGDAYWSIICFEAANIGGPLTFTDAFSAHALSKLRSFVEERKSTPLEKEEYSSIVRQFLNLIDEAPSIDFAIGQIWTELEKQAYRAVQIQERAFVEMAEIPVADYLKKDLHIYEAFGCHRLEPLVEDASE